MSEVERAHGNMQFCGLAQEDTEAEYDFEILSFLMGAPIQIAELISSERGDTPKLIASIQQHFLAHLPGSPYRFSIEEKANVIHVSLIYIRFSVPVLKRIEALPMPSSKVPN